MFERCISCLNLMFLCYVHVPENNGPHGNAHNSDNPPAMQYMNRMIWNILFLTQNTSLFLIKFFVFVLFEQQLNSIGIFATCLMVHNKQVICSNIKKHVLLDQFDRITQPKINQICLSTFFLGNGTRISSLNKHNVNQFLEKPFQYLIFAWTFLTHTALYEVIYWC